MHKIFAKTLFLGKKVYFLPECHSTNSFALDLISQGSVSEGCTIITENQTNGKGQRGNHWESDKGMNITMSLVLRPKFLTPIDQFSLHLLCSLAVHDAFFSILGSKLKIKWPNDMLYEGRKIAGILIENTLRGNSLEYSVIGIGFNVNQTLFHNKNATSLKDITALTYDLEELIENILIKMESRYLQLKQAQKGTMIQQYYARLYKYQKPHLFEAEGETFTGVIQGIDKFGRLKIEVQGSDRYFDFKEVRFLQSIA